MLYFAYGSNMSSRRLRMRLARVRALGRASLPGHRRVFHKSGMDGSAKCDAWPTDCSVDVLQGVLYRVPDDGWPVLDRFEGVGSGYRRVAVTVRTGREGLRPAWTYRATRLDPLARPYCWYLGHVLAGALEFGLRDDVVDALRAEPCVPDPDRARSARERSIHDAGTVV